MRKVHRADADVRERRPVSVRRVDCALLLVLALVASAARAQDEGGEAPEPAAADIDGERPPTPFLTPQKQRPDLPPTDVFVAPPPGKQRPPPPDAPVKKPRVVKPPKPPRTPPPRTVAPRLPAPESGSAGRGPASPPVEAAPRKLDPESPPAALVQPAPPAENELREPNPESPPAALVQPAPPAENALREPNPESPPAALVQPAPPAENALREPNPESPPAPARAPPPEADVAPEPRPRPTRNAFVLEAPEPVEDAAARARAQDHDEPDSRPAHPTRFAATAALGAWAMQASDGTGHTVRFTYGIRAGYELSDWLAVELSVLRATASAGTAAVNVGASYQLISARLGWLYARGPAKVIVGVGPAVALDDVTYTVVDGGTGDGPLSNLTTSWGVAGGVGFRMGISSLELRLDVDGVRRSSRNELVMTAGIGVAL